MIVDEEKRASSGESPEAPHSPPGFELADDTNEITLRKKSADIDGNDPKSQ